MKRILYTTFGILCVIIGTVGIVFPILPTTPFLLLAAWLFARSNEKFHHWLINHPIHGEYIRDYLEKHAVKKSHRSKALILLWSGMFLTMFLVKKPMVFLILTPIGLIVSIHLLRLRLLPETKRKDPLELPVNNPPSIPCKDEE